MRRVEVLYILLLIHFQGSPLGHLFANILLFATAIIGCTRNLCSLPILTGNCRCQLYKNGRTSRPENNFCILLPSTKKTTPAISKHIKEEAPVTWILRPHRLEKQIFLRIETFFKILTGVDQRQSFLPSLLPPSFVATKSHHSFHHG